MSWAQVGSDTDPYQLGLVYTKSKYAYPGYTLSLIHIFLVDKHTGNIQHYANSQEFHNQNVSAYIISMLFNDDGTVWLGTEGEACSFFSPAPS